MLELIEQFAMLNRVPAGPDTRCVTEAMAKRIEADVREVASGTIVLDWEIPPEWHVHRGRLTGPDGSVIADYEENPLYLRSCCTSFSGSVSLDVLMEHVCHNPDRREAIPFDYRGWYDARQRSDWGFSLPTAIVESLASGQYCVEIQTEFRGGSLCYIDHSAPGATSDTILLAAHTCHPAQVSDGLANVAVLIELFEWIASTPRHLTYRLVLGPEYFTAAAVLDEGRDLGAILGGIYLDLAASDTRLAWSRSSSGLTWMDHVLSTTVSECGIDALESGYRGVIGNDEMFYDGPGFNIPVLPICRALPDEYHTSHDDLDHCRPEKLDEMLSFLRRVIECAEREDRPRSLVAGPVSLSRRGIQPLDQGKPWGRQTTQRVLMALDGRHSISQVAEIVQLPVADINHFVDELRAAGAVAGSTIQGVTTQGQVTTG